MNEIFTGGAIAGFIAAIVGFWNQIKSILWKVISIVLQKVEINTEEAHEAITVYLNKYFRRIPLYDKVFGAQNENFRNGKYGLVSYEKYGMRTVLFFSNRKLLRWLPFIFSMAQTNENQEPTVRNQSSDRKFSSFIFIRGTLKVDEIIKESIEERNKAFWEHTAEVEENNRFDIFYLPNKENNNYEYYSRSINNVAWYKQEYYRLLGVNPNDLGKERSTGGKALDNLFFPIEVKNLIGIISLWVKSRDWYRSKNIPWKRGWLLYGPPGTGKTALVRAFAEDLNMPIYVYSLSEMSNSELTSAWKRMQVNTPCIALIEDIDTVFNKRENISRESVILSSLFRPSANSERGDTRDNQNLKYTPLTFDCFLNCLDGVDKSNGIFTIITTNKIDSIDEAIGVPVKNDDGSCGFVSSRPGRIDKAIELTYMSDENKTEMARKILDEFPNVLSNIIDSIPQREKETPAQFQEYCSQIAIKEYWNRSEQQSELF